MLLFMLKYPKTYPRGEKMYGSRRRFQQDNHPKNTQVILLKDFLKNVAELIDWLSNSPDLNPIENIWRIIKNKLEKRRQKSR